MIENIRLQGFWKMVFYGSSGLVKAEFDWENVVTLDGKNHMLERYFISSNRFIGLLKSGTPAETWTATEVLANNLRSEYIGSRKQFIADATPTAASVTNSASPATFEFQANATVTGAYISPASGKNSSSGKIYAAGTFGASQAVESGDFVKVTATFTAT